MENNIPKDSVHNEHVNDNSAKNEELENQEQENKPVEANSDNETSAASTESNVEKEKLSQEEEQENKPEETNSDNEADVVNTESEAKETEQKNAPKEANPDNETEIDEVDTDKPNAEETDSSQTDEQTSEPEENDEDKESNIITVESNTEETTSSQETEQENTPEETASDNKTEIEVDTDKPKTEETDSSQKNEQTSDSNKNEEDKDSGEDIKEKEAKVAEVKAEKEEEKPDYATLSKEDLVAAFKDLLEKVTEHEDYKDDTEQIKSIFYKKHRQEIDEKKKRFLEEGGDIIDFKPEADPLENELKELLEKYKGIKSDLNKKLEEEKEQNLQEKYNIIDELKELVNREESLNKTFKEFHSLQTRWREIGLVPQQHVKNLWETYHHHVEKFYDYIKINKELRDLDLKKNLEEKINLCEKAERLVIETNVVQAFKELQRLHDQWREIGPVPRENREEMWLRFKDATSKINKTHQDFFVKLKDEQKHNLEQKQALCEKAEEIANLEISNFKEWDEKTKEVVELQKVWKTIGFAPKRDNVKIYERFRSACDAFFKKKREFYAHIREEQGNNLQLKTDLCVQAEALKDSTDWKKTTDELIALQKRWKEIGPVPKKYSDQVWKRFRTACDTFFNNKSNFFSNIDEQYEENLKKKEEIIKQIEEFSFGGTPEENFNTLKELQRQWTEIGFVPLNKKDEIQRKYRDAINVKFDKLKIDDDEKTSAKFHSKLEDLSTKPNGMYRMIQDRDKMIIKIKQLENDVTLWENNKGFFANSKNAQALIADVEKKIDNAKEKITQLEQKITHINNFLDNKD